MENIGQNDFYANKKHFESLGDDSLVEKRDFLDKEISNMETELSGRLYGQSTPESRMMSDRLIKLQNERLHVNNEINSRV